MTGYRIIGWRILKNIIKSLNWNMKKIILCILILLISSCDLGKGKRIGAICNDGWRSYATGQGACSHHGGVDYWLYE